MSVETAMRHWAVWACVRVIADTISALPVDAFARTGDFIEPLPQRLITPSAYATKLEWLWQIMASLLTQGNAYGLISAEDRLGYPTQVDLISPQAVRVEKQDGRKVFLVGGKTLTTEQMWHLPGPQLPGELEGMSPLRYAARTIGLGLQAEQFGTDFFQNGIHPTATLETDQQVNSDQAVEIKDRVRKSMASREMVVLGAGMKLNPWQLKAEDAQFLETQRYNATAVAQIFGVPAEMIGAADSGSTVTYANREQRAQDFLNNAINPWLARLEDSLTAWFPRGTYVKFNTGALLRSDLLNRYKAHEIGIRNNFLLPSEARGLENLPKINGIDDKPLPATAPGNGGGSSQGSGNNGQSG
jgi:HK97 family phage portal protein